MLGLLGPFIGQGVLAFQTAQFIEFLAQRFGSTLVARAHFFENLLQQIGAGLGGHPFTQTRGSFARSGGGQGAASQGIQGGQIKCAGRRGVHVVSNQ